MAGCAAVGAVSGMGMAQHAISQVPIETETVEWMAPVTQKTQIGTISSDFYQSGTIEPYQDSARTMPIFRDQAVMQDGQIFGQSSSSQVKMTPRTEVRKGHGTPTTHTEARTIEGYEFQGQNRSVSRDYETRQVGTRTEMRTQVVSHRTRQESYTIPGPCTSVYSSNGSSSRQCASSSTGTRTVSEPVYGQVAHQVPVYRDFLVGFKVDYSERVATQNLGTYQYPVTQFDHGIDVGDFVGKGLLAGLGAGGLLAGGGTLLASSGLLADRNRRADFAASLNDPSLHTQSMDPEWRISTATGTTRSDADLDKVLGPFQWHAHEDASTGQTYWDYHRVPANTWHQHRASVSQDLVVADKAHQDLVGDNWIAFKRGDEPVGYNDPQFDTYNAHDPEAGDLIFIDMLSKDGIMERRGGPDQAHPSIPGIIDHKSTITRNHNLSERSKV